jgi:hypothetical protein
MLNSVTGVPGASKTAYVVTQLFNQERKNKINLIKNIQTYLHNKPFFLRYLDDFSYIDLELGSGHELKKTIEVLPVDYFDMLGQEFEDLRPDDYYVRVIRYNEIIDRISDRGEKHNFQYFQPVRTIYTNIKALKIDYVRALVIDWRTCPDGSIIVIDEVQLVPPYNDNKNKTDDIVQELTIHRHRGFDFWFITQSASYLHPTIKELISCHLHITRPYWRTPKVYQFGSLRQYPNTLINKLNCESKFDFKPKEHIFKLYKSTSIDTSKKRTPKGLIGFALFILCGISIMFYGLSGGSGFLGHFFGGKDNATKNHASAPPASSSTANRPAVTSSGNSSSMGDLSLECRKGINVEKPECVEWFNQISQNTASSSTQPNQVLYNPNKPYETKLPESYMIQVTDVPRLSGCMTLSNGQLIGIDQQGNYMQDIAQSDCKRYMNGFRPFDYSGQPQQQQAGRSAQQQQVSNPETLPL